MVPKAQHIFSFGLRIFGPQTPSGQNVCAISTFFIILTVPGDGQLQLQNVSASVGLALLLGPGRNLPQANGPLTKLAVSSLPRVPQRWVPNLGNRPKAAIRFGNVYFYTNLCRWDCSADRRHGLL